MEQPSGYNSGNKLRPIGIEIDPLRSPTEGHSAEGRPSQLVKDEFPTKIDEVSKTLFYLGWAVLGADEGDTVWKIRRIQQVGSVWEQRYAYGNQFYRYVWDSRSDLPYL